jgi:hypothetical protein
MATADADARGDNQGISVLSGNQVERFLTPAPPYQCPRQSAIQVLTVRIRLLHASVLK